MSARGDQPVPHAHVALEARHQRRARWVTAAGLVAATGVTIALLASAQGPTGASTSPAAVATVDTAPAQSGVGVAQAGITSPAIEPAPLGTGISGSPGSK